ncbi:hypothetical protein [Pelagibacterium montanilacus]|uniref:hypothetical protein n=1 Tax=Pelagibacterium montanilacus TaxID=2185280 RepID=UPI000F8DFA6B|nr:hypothetical protein [Pelagibacterium montanilacus]
MAAIADYILNRQTTDGPDCAVAAVTKSRMSDMGVVSCLTAFGRRHKEIGHSGARSTSTTMNSYFRHTAIVSETAERRDFSFHRGPSMSSSGSGYVQQPR